MADQESSPKKKRSKRNCMYGLLIIVSVLFIAWPFITWGSLGIADWLFEGINFPETSRFGISGDMYGGLNALFSGSAFICFIYALRQQRLELQLQRRELSLQRRELRGRNYYGGQYTGGRSARCSCAACPVVPGSGKTERRPGDALRRQSRGYGGFSRRRQVHGCLFGNQPFVVPDNANRH